MVQSDDTPGGRYDFARRLYTLMIRKGWLQSDLAHAAGLPRDEVSAYVRGVAKPPPEALEKLATALDVTPEELIGVEPPSHRANLSVVPDDTDPSD